jgi:hypothetical protein
MLIKISSTFTNPKYGQLTQGIKYFIDDAVAQEFINRGLADLVVIPPKAKP